ncbi:hypothetical protein MK489_12340 [Myxococcota bacterium]|nr:hypothetical protein [Myxococcota bacterium]
MTRVLVTHADSPIGRRIVKTLRSDDSVESVLAVSQAPTPPEFDNRSRGPIPGLSYQRADLAKPRSMRRLFRSPTFESARVDTVLHIPWHGLAPLPPVSGLPRRTAELRLLLKSCREAGTVENFVCLGSAFVYQLLPGNANRLDEGSELDFDPDVGPDIRSWIDCDMMLHEPLNRGPFRTVLLRVPSVVSDDGSVYFNPSVSGRPGPRLRALGFDPMSAILTEKDLTQALLCAIHSRESGIFNVAGRGAIPLSQLARWNQCRSLAVPPALLGWMSSGARMLGNSASLSEEGPHLRYGFTLDTTRAERDLFFRPSVPNELVRQMPPPATG